MLAFMVAAMVLFAASLYGWGWGARRLLRMPAGRDATTLALGLAAIIFLGGILNLSRLALEPALGLAVLAGLALAGWAVQRDGVRLKTAIVAGRWRLAVVLVLGLTMLSFTVATQLPPSAYNAADDYGKYFFHPVRMLATGTLFGSAMSDLGSETLGGKAFLDGFVAAVFPLRFLNATDAVFGLFACLMLAGSFARRIWAAALCVAIVFLIDPQYMNISALYLGSALMMTAVALSADSEEMGGGILAAALGLVYADLIALKTTFALFVVVHLAFVAVAVSINGSLKAGVRFSLRTVLWSVAFLSPWVLLYVSYYVIAILHHPNSLQTYGYGPVEKLGVFSLAWLTYGSAIVQYTLSMVAAFVASVIVIWGGLRNADNARLSKLAIAAAGAAGLTAYFIMFYVFGPRLSGYGEATRYFAPIAIAIVPAVLGLADFHLKRAWQSLALLLVPVAAFSLSVFPRVAEAMNEHFILAFSFARAQDYRNLDTLVTSEGMQAHVRKMQEMVPKGQPIVVWINAPFDLDLRRNRIVDMDSAGLATPWAAIPDTGYVIWEYRGYAMPLASHGVEKSSVVGLHERIIAGQELKFSVQLARYAQEGAVLYNDKRFVVIRMPGTD